MVLKHLLSHGFQSTAPEIKPTINNTKYTDVAQLSSNLCSEAASRAASGQSSLPRLIYRAGAGRVARFYFPTDDTAPCTALARASIRPLSTGSFTSSRMNESTPRRGVGVGGSLRAVHTALPTQRCSTSSCSSTVQQHPRLPLPPPASSHTSLLAGANMIDNVVTRMNGGHRRGAGVWEAVAAAVRGRRACRVRRGGG